MAATPACGTTVTDTSVRPTFQRVLTPAPQQAVATEYRVVTDTGGWNYWLRAQPINSSGRSVRTSFGTFAQLRAAYAGFKGIEYRLNDTPSVTVPCFWQFEGTGTPGTPTVETAPPDEPPPVETTPPDEPPSAETPPPDEPPPAETPRLDDEITDETDDDGDPTTTTGGGPGGGGGTTRPTPPPMVTLTATPNPVDEGASVTVTATLSATLAEAVTIPVALTAGTAEADDYGPLAGITVAAGARSGTGTVTMAQDEDTEDETFTVSLGALPSSVTAGSPSSVAVTITDDDGGPPPLPPPLPPPMVTLTATPNPVDEGASVTVTATLSSTLTEAVTIPVTLTAGTAEADDYGALAGITVDAGARSGTGTVTTAQDEDTEDERFTVSLGALPSSVTAGSPSSVAVTITDDDSTAEDLPPVPTTLTLSAAPAPAEGGGPVTVTARLDNPAPSGGTRVTLSLAAGTATAGASGDFTLSSTTIEIAEGATEGRVTLRVIDDAADDDGETVVVEAESTNPVLTAAPLTLTITDNDDAGVTVSRTVLSVARSDTATYTVVLDSRPMADVVVTATSGTPAKATVTPASVRFTPGGWNTAKTFTVTGVEAGATTITHGASSRDGKYGGGLSIDSVAVTVTAVTAAPPQAVKPAWHARFGRTVTGQVLEAVESRLAAPRHAGVRATLAGQPRQEWTPMAGAANGNVWVGPDGRSGSGAWDAELLTGSSFALTGRAVDDGGGQVGLWGRGAHARFAGREDDLVLDGEVTAALLGADWTSAPGLEAGRWSAGLAVGHARGAGDYDSTSIGKGAVEAAVTGLYPYAGVALAEWLSTWAAAGYGLGEVTVTARDRAAFKADLTLAMGAAGIRSEVARPPADGGDGLFLAMKGDARFTHTSSAAARSSAGNLAASEADTWLARAGVEGAWRFALGNGDGAVSLTPSLEVGARLDGGDAESGFGMDLGGGIAYADPKSGLGLDLEAHGLVAHEAADFRGWGASVLAAFGPRSGTDRGLSLSLRQSLGAAPAGGVDALLSRETLAGLAGNGLGAGTGAGDNAGLRVSSRLEGEISYGLAVLGGGFIGTPSLGFGLSDGMRDWRVGWRLTSVQPGDSGFEVSIEATRREAGSGNKPPEHGATLRAIHRW